MKSFIQFLILSIISFGLISADFSSDEDFEENSLPDALCNQIYESEGNGHIITYGDALEYIKNREIRDGFCEFDFTSDFMKICEQNFFIGQKNSVNQIQQAQISFYDEYGNILLNNQGIPLQFLSKTQAFGQRIQLINQNFPYSYAKCRLQLQPDCNFDPNTLFFHFPQSLLTSSKSETDQDCGGICVPIRKCPVDSSCKKSSDCKSGFCASNVCLPSHCNNSYHDKGESDANCGGTCSLGLKCNVTQSCNYSSDCQSDLCLAGKCLPLHCINSQKDENETGLDCGGVCSPEKKCCNYMKCNKSSDCISNSCINNICEPIDRCSKNCLNHCRPYLLITFGSGENQFSNATASTFNFSTALKKGNEENTSGGHYSFPNKRSTPYSEKYNFKQDHTFDDVNGYFYLANIDEKNQTIFNYTIDELCIGLCYEFSAYMADFHPKLRETHILPNITFQVRTDDVLAEIKIDGINQYNEPTWAKYGLSFNATTSSVTLLIICDEKSSEGNDLLIDDIELRTCSNDQSRSCLFAQKKKVFSLMKSENSRLSFHSTQSEETYLSRKTNFCEQILFYVPLIISLILLLSGILLFIYIEQKHNRHNQEEFLSFQDNSFKSIFNETFLQLSCSFEKKETLSELDFVLNESNCGSNRSSLIYFSYTKRIHFNQMIHFDKRMIYPPNFNFNWTFLSEINSISFISILLDPQFNNWGIITILLHEIRYFSLNIRNGLSICLYHPVENLKFTLQPKILLFYRTNQSYFMILTKTTCYHSSHSFSLSEYIQLIQLKLIATTNFTIENYYFDFH
ncbi:hypothetical protein I4U23_031214 [Adineta vaga]|nr:hypothetical protein I4U23_031214 [Adineta vaga]